MKIRLIWIFFFYFLHLTTLLRSLKHSATFHDHTKISFLWKICISPNYLYLQNLFLNPDKCFWDFGAVLSKNIFLYIHFYYAQIFVWQSSIEKYFLDIPSGTVCQDNFTKPLLISRVCVGAMMIINGDTSINVCPPSSSILWKMSKDKQHSANRWLIESKSLLVVSHSFEICFLFLDYYFYEVRGNICDHTRKGDLDIFPKSWLRILMYKDFPACFIRHDSGKLIILETQALNNRFVLG